MNPVALTSLPPELFSVIASFIPLRSAPRTLRALALGNRRFYNICRPLLYSRLILRKEDDAIDVIQRIMDEPQLGLFVKELYIMSELSVAARQRKEPFDVVVGLQMLLANGLIPRITALGLYWLQGCTLEENFRITVDERLFSDDFWTNLRNQCPRLRTLILRNVGHSFMDPWLTGPLIDEMISLSGILALRFEWKDEPLKDDINLRILNNPCRLESSLHTLALKIYFYETPDLLSLSFPYLKWLHLSNFSAYRDAEKVEQFFRRHSQLESLSLEQCTGVWFSDNNVEVGFLPNLKHLKARFEDIRLLVPILSQLISLGFTESHNAQVPYLLRSLLPNGLPRLRSLEIQQRVKGWGEEGSEGDVWYETLDGQFRTAKKGQKMQRDFLDGYMHSIVRGAPNLEELALHGMDLTSASLKTLEPTLSQFVKMERFYYRGYSPNPKYGNPPNPLYHERLLYDFLSSAKALGRVCARLEAVTSISGESLPYVSGAIERSSVGDVTAVRPVVGVGLVIPADENDPFPCYT